MLKAELLLVTLQLKDHSFMRKIYLFLIVVVTMMSCNTSSVSVFDRVERLCNKDGGKIWGINIYSPVIGIDSLRNIISNVQDAPTVYPSDLPVANSTTEFDGKRWTMVLWPLSGSVQSQNTLLIHEMFHYRQSELKLIPTLTPNNAHLSFRDARTLIKLEWNALKVALACKRQDKIDALTDAMIFRRLRRQHYPEYADDENALEILEGIAEYTGRRFATSSVKKSIAGLKDFDYLYTADNITRSFAYLSGPLYGFALDQSGLEWHKLIDSSCDLGALLSTAYNIDIPDDLSDAYEMSRLKYGFSDIDEQEEAYEREQAAKEDVLRRLFSKDNVIVIDCKNLSIQFPPNGMVQQEDGSMLIYGGKAYFDSGYVTGNPFKLSGDWKQIELPKLDTLSVKGDTIITSGWTLVRK